MITCNDEYKSEYAYLPEDVFSDLETFIHEYTSSEDGADALEFLKIGYKRNLGKTISVTNYVGLIQMNNGYQIQVLRLIWLRKTLTEQKLKKCFSVCLGL